MVEWWEAEGRNVLAARRSVWKRLPAGWSIWEEEVLSDGEPRTIESIGDTFDAANRRTREQLPPGAIVDKSVTLAEPSVSEQEFACEEQSEELARRLVCLSPTQRLTALRLKIAGRGGVLGFGARLTVYAATIRQQAVLQVTFRLPAKIRCAAGPYRHWFEKSDNVGDDGGFAHVLRHNPDVERLALLRCLSAKRHPFPVKTGIALIGLLADPPEALRREAIQLIVDWGMLETAAWRLAYENRQRACYYDELKPPQTRTIAEFAGASLLTQEQVHRAREYLRAHAGGDSDQAAFDRAWKWHTRNEPTTSAQQLAARRRVPVECLKCRAVRRVAYAGSYVELHCSACGQVSYENPEEAVVDDARG